VLRGQELAYSEFIGGFARDEVDPMEWKHLLDQSDWAKRNPRRWSVIDAWITLGMRLRGRSYAEFLSDYPTMELAAESVAEVVVTRPRSLRTLLRCGVEPPGFSGNPARFLDDY
jgi:hypothetical protein